MDLSSKKMDEIRAIAKELGMKNIGKYKKSDLIALIEEQTKEIKKEEPETKQEQKIMEEPAKKPAASGENKEKPKVQANHKTGLMLQGDDNLVGGILEVLAEGYGFLRGENYLSTPKDVYVSPTQIRRFNLKTGDKVTGIGRMPKDGEKFPALIFVQHVNDDTPDKAIRRKPFEYLTPIYPEERIYLENGQQDYAMRMVDLIAPIGKGQRGLIVAPPKAG